MTSAHPAPQPPTVTVVVDDLATAFERYKTGEVNAATMARLIPRTARQLGHACFCDSGDCCAIHQTHVSPHTGCVLR